MDPITAHETAGMVRQNLDDAEHDIRDALDWIIGALERPGATDDSANEQRVRIRGQANDLNRKFGRAREKGAELLEGAGGLIEGPAEPVAWHPPNDNVVARPNSESGDDLRKTIDDLRLRLAKLVKDTDAPLAAIEDDWYADRPDVPAMAFDVARQAHDARRAISAAAEAADVLANDAASI